MTTRISGAATVASANAVVALIDGGAGPGYLEVRTGTQPPTVADTATGTLLSTHTMSVPAFSGAVDQGAYAEALANVIASANAAATGDAGWFRCHDSNGVAVFDGACREVADPDAGEEMIFNEKSFVQGGLVNINSLAYRTPESE